MVVAVLAALFPAVALVSAATTPTLVYTINRLNVTGAFNDEYSFGVKLSSSISTTQTYTLKHTAFRFSQCSVSFDSTNWNITQIIKVQPLYRRGWSQADNTADTISAYSSTNVKYSLPVVRDAFIGQSCSVTGDPHFDMFDGKHLDYQTPHTLWVIKSPSLNIQCQSKDCWSGVGQCLKSCSIQYTDGSSTALFNVFANTTSEVFMLPIINENNLMSKFEYHVGGSRLHIWFPDGASTDFTLYTTAYTPDLQERLMDLKIDVPPTYTNVAEGLCAGYNMTPHHAVTADYPAWRYSWTVAADDSNNQIYQVLKNRTAAKPFNYSSLYEGAGISVTDAISSFFANLTGESTKFNFCNNTFLNVPSKTVNLTTSTISASNKLPAADFGVTNSTKWMKSELIYNRTSFYPGVNVHSYKATLMKRSDDMTEDNTTEIAVEETVVFDDVATPVPSDLGLAMCRAIMEGMNCSSIIAVENKIVSCALDFDREVTAGANATSAVSFEIHKTSAQIDCSTTAGIIISTLPQDTVASISEATGNKTKLAALKSKLSSHDQLALSAMESLGVGAYSGTTQCLNGGVKNEDGSCDCTKGYSGTTCDVSLSSLLASVSDSSKASGAMPMASASMVISGIALVLALLL